MLIGFYIDGKRRMWAPCLEEELVSYVVLVFVLHDTLWDQDPNCWDEKLLLLKDGNSAKQWWQLNK